jgi:hypothetical protein
MILPDRIRPDLLASKYVGRYAMHLIHLELRDGVALLEATDGKVLGRWTLELEEGEAWPTDSFDEGPVRSILLDAKALGRGMRRAGEKRLRLIDEGQGPEWRDGTRREFAVVTLDRHGREKSSERVPARREAGDWPKVDAVLDGAEKRSSGSSLAVDPALLARMGQALGDTSVVKVDLGQPKDPIRFVADGFVGLVMPITLEV